MKVVVIYDEDGLIIAEVSITGDQVTVETDDRYGHTVIDYQDKENES